MNGKAGISVDNGDPVTASHIEEACAASGNGLGWRLLASPVDVLNDAEVAFVWPNPGGREERPDHPRFATHTESAYVSA